MNDTPPEDCAAPLMPVAPLAPDAEALAVITAALEILRRSAGPKDTGPRSGWPSRGSDRWRFSARTWRAPAHDRRERPGR